MIGDEGAKAIADILSINTSVCDFGLGGEMSQEREENI